MTSVEYNTLTTNYKPQEVARWIQSAKNSMSVSELASSLEKALFTKWFNAKYDALGVKEMLRASSTGKPLDAQRDKEIVQAFREFAKQQKLA